MFRFNFHYQQYGIPKKGELVIMVTSSQSASTSVVRTTRMIWFVRASYCSNLDLKVHIFEHSINPLSNAHL